MSAPRSVELDEMVSGGDVVGERLLAQVVEGVQFLRDLQQTLVQNCSEQFEQEFAESFDCLHALVPDALFPGRVQVDREPLGSLRFAELRILVAVDARQLQILARVNLIGEFLVLCRQKAFARIASVRRGKAD